MAERIIKKTNCHVKEYLQQQTVTTMTHHRTQQEILSSCGKQTLKLICLRQRGQQRHGVLSMILTVNLFILLCIFRICI